MEDRIRIRSEEILSDDWAVLKKTVLDYRRRDGQWETQVRQTYDRGDGAVILPYDPQRSTVLLVRQFRYPAYVTGHREPLIEACAGLLDGFDIAIGTAISDDQWSAAFESVFLGAVRLARELGTALPAGGSLGLVLSSSVRAPLPEMAISNGLRPGLAMVAKTLADELGPRGVRVNGLLPGRIATERVAELDASTGDPGAARRAAEASIPLGRYGEPQEFGRVAAFVLSPAASFLTGVMLPVDGGLLRAL